MSFSRARNIALANSVHPYRVAPLISEYADALIDRDLAGQVRAIRSLHQAGVAMDELVRLTECDSDFIESLLR